MKLVELEQGTEEWLDWRRSKLSASNAGVIMLDTPSWMPVRTWEALRGRSALFGNIDPEPEERSEFLERAAEHGLKTEPIARARFAPDLPAVCGEMDEDDRFAASLDGWNPETRTWLEIKCPMVGRRSKHLTQWAQFEGRRIDKRIQGHVWWQLVHQAGVIGDPLATCQFVVWVDEDHYINKKIPAYSLLSCWPELKEQWLRWAMGEDPPRTCNTCGAVEWSLEPLTDGHCWECKAINVHMEEEKAAERSLKGLDDRETATHEYLSALAEHTRVKARLDEAKEALIHLGPGEGYGVKVSVHKYAGAIDWQKAARSAYDGRDSVTAWSEGFRKAEPNGHQDHRDGGVGDDTDRAGQEAS